MTLLVQRHFRPRRIIGLAPLIVLAVTADRAEAACTPAAPVSDVTVTCSGDTINANGTTGYGTNQDQNNTYNILSGASVKGTAIGLRFDREVVINNSGTIEGGNSGVQGIRGTLNNFGAISATGNFGLGVFMVGTGTVNNFGSITGVSEGVAIQNGAVANMSTGTIVGGRIGVEIGDDASLSNAGLISGVRGITVKPANSSHNVVISNTGSIVGAAAGIESLRLLDLKNAGSIVATDADGSAISSTSANVTNSGTISGGAFGIIAPTAADVINSGTISANSFAINADAVAVTNSGTISGGNRGILASTATVDNSGAITALTSAGIAIRVFDTANVVNRAGGTIAGGADGILAANVINLNNAGTISGNTGIEVFNPVQAGTIGSTIDNSGAIVGTGGTAIKLTSAADTLTLRPGSRIVGVVDMGLGADVVNVVVSAPNTRVSTLTSVAIPTFINFTGVINTSFSAGNNNPAVSSGTTLATLDPTAWRWPIARCWISPAACRRWCRDDSTARLLQQMAR